MLQTTRSQGFVLHATAVKQEFFLQTAGMGVPSSFHNLQGRTAVENTAPARPCLPAPPPPVFSQASRQKARADTTVRGNWYVALV